MSNPAPAKGGRKRGASSSNAPSASATMTSGRASTPSTSSASTAASAAVDPLTPPATPLSPEVNEVGPPPRPSQTGTSKRARAMQKLAEISSKLVSGEYKAITNVSRKRAWEEQHAKSGARDASEFCLWDKMLVIVRADTSFEVGAVQCVECKKVLAYDSCKTGTSSLSSHVRSTCPREVARKAAGPAFVAPPPDAKSAFVDKVADFCAFTLSSMNHIASEATVAMIQAAIDIGMQCAKDGRVDARELLPCANTVANRIEERANAAREIVTERVGEAIDDGRCRCTTDMWTDNANRYNFIDVTAHFSEKSCKESESHFLLLAKFPTTSEKSATNIRNAIFSEMAKLGFTAQQFEKIEWVTDRGANIKKAFERSVRDDCTAHVINTVVGTTLTFSHLELRQKALRPEEVMKIIRPVEEAARAVKKATDPKKLKVEARVAKKLHNVIQLPRPQFSSYVGMLQSVTAHKREVSAVLKDLGKDDLVLHLENEAIQDVIDFLLPVERTGDVPAGNMEKLRRHLELHDDDPPVVRLMKQHVSKERLIMELLVEVKSCKDLVNYLKTSNLGQLLDKRLLQEVETRWNSLCDMLESLLNQYEKVQDILGEAKQQDRMAGITKESVAWLVEFLRPFRDETVKLQAEDYPTLPLVVPCKFKLQKHCVPALFDTPAQEALRERAGSLLETKLEPSMQQKISTFLWPKYRQLLMLPLAEREEVFQKVREIISRDRVDPDDPGADATIPNSPSSPVADGPPQPAPPKQRRVDDGYDEWESVEPEEEMDEVMSYLKCAPKVDIDQMYTFWKPQLSADPRVTPFTFPHVAKLAHREMGKPATSAASERVFSLAGFVIQARRNRLAPKTVDNILFLHGFLRNKTKIGL